MSDLTDQIEKLKIEVRAMQTDPLLKDKTYVDKVKLLMKLRRKLNSTEKNSRG